MQTEVRFIEAPETRFVDRRRKVWLECDGEPYDLRSVELLGRRSLARDIVLLRFICPR